MTAKKSDHAIEKLPPVLTVRRASQVAGVSRRTMRKWAHDNLVKCSRPHGGEGSARYYIDTQSLLDLLRGESS